MTRNFGSPNSFSRRELSSCATTGVSANAGASFFSWKAAAKRLYDSLGKTHRPSGQQVSVYVQYMGRVLFHVGEGRMVPQESLTRVRGEK